MTLFNPSNLLTALNSEHASISEACLRKPLLLNVFENNFIFRLRFISTIHWKPQDFLAKKDKQCEDIRYLPLPLAPLLWVISASKHQTPHLSPSSHTKALKQKKSNLEQVQSIEQMKQPTLSRKTNINPRQIKWSAEDSLHFKKICSYIISDLNGEDTS